MIPRTPFVFLAALVLATASACHKRTLPAQAATSGKEPAVSPAGEGHAGHGAEGEHSAEAGEPSDLDRPVDELMALTCEHGRKTFECPECRYETGFVRAPASLVEGGLLKRVKASRQRVAQALVLTGEVRFDERRVAHVSTQVEGVIKKAHVALGDRVKAGQPLLEIESVAISEAQAAHREAQAMLELARGSFERQAELRKENITSEREYLQAKQEFEAAQVRVRGAMGKLTRLGTDGDRRLVLRAPMDGTVLVMHGVPGEVAKTEEPLVTVGDSGSVWVWADVYERDIGAVLDAQRRQPLEASVAVKAYPGREFAGTVSLVSPSMDESSRTVKARVAVKNPEGRLLAGMFATVKVFLPGTEETVAIPRDAVLEDEGRTFAFVHHHADYYVRRPVEVGRRWAGQVEVRRGLAVNDTVVAEGAFLLKSDVLRSKMGAGCAD